LFRGSDTIKIVLNILDNEGADFKYNESLTEGKEAFMFLHIHLFIVSTESRK
jgi:hypothetical protein